MSKTDLNMHLSLIKSGPNRQKSLLRTNIVLLSALLVIIFLMPVIPLDAPLLSKILLGLVVISGLLAADFSSSMFRILVSFAIAVLAVTGLSMFFNDSDTLTYITFFLNTVFFILITIALVTHVAGSNNVSSSTLLCAVNSYLLIGLSLSMLFIILDLIVPNSFNLVGDEANKFSTFLYYGFVTLTTLGYGDILALTPLARSLSTFTALFGQLYLVIIMAFLIGKYLNAKNQGS
jgi:hypothetical protein